MEQEQRNVGHSVDKLVQDYSSGLNALKRKKYSKDVQNVLRDPFLWIRLKYASPTTGEKLQSLNKLNNAGDAEPILHKRVRLCGSSLSLSSETNPPGRLTKFFANSKNITDEDLRNVLFPDEIFDRLPDVLSEAGTLSFEEEEVREEGEVATGRGPAEGTEGIALKGMVTDLYSCPESGGWEGFVWSFYDPKRGRRWEPVYRFTLSSCSSVFPVYLGAIAEFYPSCNNPSKVADSTFRMLEYWPDSLPEGFAGKYLQKLEEIQSPSDCSQRICDLPGPFHSLVNEGRFYNVHQSNILVVFSHITKGGVDNSQDILCLFHASKFIRELPQTLLHQNKGKQGNSCAPACVQYEGDVHTLTHLVALCIQSFPERAFELVQVIQNCMKLVMAAEEGNRFKAEAVVLSHAIVDACSQARCSEIMESSTGLASAKQKGTENEAGVTGVQSLETAAAKQKEKHQPKSKLPVVKKMIVEGTSSHGPNRRGIIVDLYEDGFGYIALTHTREFLSRRSKNRVFKIISDPTKLPSFPVTVHIGDVVEFEVSPSPEDTASSIVKVIKYCPEALDVEFALDILAPKNISLGDGAFQNEAAWRAILNAPSVYQNMEVCKKVMNIVMGSFSEDSSSTPSTQKKMLSVLQSSSFIQDLMKIAPKEVSVSAQILKVYLQEFPSEVTALQAELKAMVTYLSDHNMLQELATFVHFLTASSCIVPPSVELSRQPWQSIPVILTREEFQGKGSPSEATLPAVKALGKYSSIHEYGRTYFMLLRADCHGDLLTAVSQLRAPQSSRRNDFEAPCYDVKLLTLSQGSGYHLVYKLHLETRPMPATESSLSDSPLLKSGNLLCLSVGGRFEDDIIWATINHVEFSGTFKTQQGEVIRSCDVQVQFCTESNSHSDEEAMQLLKASENVVAVESPAYYRAYQPVLQVLKELDLQQIHFKPDLLNPGTNPKAPLEILSDDVLVTDVAGLYREEAHSEAPRELTVKELIDVLETEEDKLCLYQFQRQAIRQALTQSLTLVQGPPGTGKSYLGLKLLQLFLSMRYSGRPLLDQKPVLVMAYKNRALDHFISECQTFCRLGDIVRIGHVSEGYEDLLKPVLLRDRVVASLPREGTIAFREALRIHYERVKEASEELAAISDLLSLDNCIPGLSQEWLQSLILDVLPDTEQLSRTLNTLKNYPERCLSLLQATQMGRKDLEIKQEIRTFLQIAWEKWVADISDYPKSGIKISPSKSSADGESETDHDALQSERLMAQDEYDDDFLLSEEISIPMFFEEVDNDGPPIDDSHVWELSPGDRKRLIVYSLQDRYEQAMERLKECVKEYNMMHEKYELRWQQKALQVLKQAKVVAMTTTGAAIHQRLLNKLEAPVVLVEEAAEILESNLLATLTPHVKHLVLLGDHKQLRPNLACSKLRKNRFDLSLFERLINNQYPYTLLMRQNRMHPDLVPLYEYHYLEQKREAGRISSSKKTEIFLKPECMGTSFFWWSYDGKCERRTGSSQCNDYEIEMVVSLCSWLVCNRVKGKRIAVLTPYRGQLREIQGQLGDRAHKHKEMPTAILDIDVNTVDEFQGHERDVVILSLVRSNPKGKIRFLKERNRLVVGSSRQKSALYIVGNCSFLKKNSPVVWKIFIERCEREYPGRIGPGIPIVVGGNKQVCETPEELDKRIDQIFEVANNNTTVQEPSLSLSELSEPCQSEAVSTTTKDENEDVDDASVSSTTTRKKDIFRKCILEIKDTAAAAKWKHIARRLDVADSVIDQLYHSCGSDLPEVFYQVIRKWQETKGKHATYDVLIEALRAEKLNEVADTVERYKQQDADILD